MKKVLTTCLLLARCSTWLLALLLAFTTARAQTPGQLDISFDPSTGGTGANGTVWTAVLQPDGKVIIGGEFLTYNGIARSGIVCLNPNGSLDSTLNQGIGATGAYYSVYTAVPQPDGKVIIGGSFTTYNGTVRNNIARLNSNGSLDTSFNPGTGVTGGNYSVSTAVLQPDGKVIIAGSFTDYNGTLRNNIARLNSDGGLDMSFDPGWGASNPANPNIHTLTLQPDGKVIIGGSFTSYNGISRNNIARLNADGSPDTSFNPGTGTDGSVHKVVLQPDGKVLIAGGFTAFSGTARNRIARLNANGSLDATFGTGSGANYSVNTIVLQPDGKVIVGGDFTTYNGISRNRIARLNADGSLDASFNSGTGADDVVNTAIVQPDGKVIIGGNFTSYDGTSRNRIARIFGGELVAAPDLVSTLVSLFPNPTNGRFTLDLSVHATSERALVEVHNLLGQTVQRSTITAGATTELNLQGLSEGAYLVRVNLAGKVLTQKVLLQP